jgi:putative SOS response-associated peptidase YedK
MCGRFVSASPPDEIAAYFEASLADEQLIEASYNVAPTDDVYAVTADDDERVLETFHWGLVPPWAESPAVGSRMINARAETVATRNAFRPALEARRCLVPADGFYEWKAVAGRPKKQPMFIHSRDGRPLAFAGLWERWTDRAHRDAPVLHSCTVITTTANELMAPIHDRMPVILPADAWRSWLGRDAEIDELLALLVPAAEDVLELHPVSADVGNVKNNDPHLIDPIDENDPSLVDPAQIPGQGSLL